ncbi:autotransporter domain-containing protein [Paracoccus sp. MBLB3053]|uniref:Autotransporter domain-containing protein n=1 Tax=Paracoccus aurantius TaxID=3073814 RepID=A0ABU2HYU4_9RHOB|nr:autotransporter domain-containing protein [Paracoccus sp. MBLB3053]MDS9469907.1 autotransporter domain-containing protein [Paracoccus sp. MBLB3053]
MNIKAFACGALLLATATSQAFAQDHRGGPPKGVGAFQKNFGAAGLLTVWGQDDTYGGVQSRINNGFSHEAKAEATGVMSGYEDDISTLLLPISLLQGLPDGQSLIYSKLTLNANRGAENPTYSEGTLPSILVSYLNMPSDNLAWGIGVVAQQADTEMKHNGGNIDSTSAGLRGDLLYVMNDNWAMAHRVIASWGDATTEIPTPVGTISEDRSSSLFYYQGDLVGTYTDRDMSALGDGWVFHPRLGVVAQHITRDEATNSRGATVSEAQIDYGMVQAIARIEKPTFKPGDWSPQFELGMKHEFENSVGEYMDEENYLYSQIALGTKLENGAYFNAAYTRDDGFNGNRRTQTFKLIYSMSF